MRQMQRQVPGQDWDLEWLREELGLGRRGGVQMGEAPSGVGVGCWGAFGEVGGR